MFSKPKRVKDKKLLARKRAEGCAVLDKDCVPFSIHAHHLTTVGAGGGDTEDNVIGLCVRHHQIIHNIGVRSMAKKYKRVRDYYIKIGRYDLLKDK